MKQAHVYISGFVQGVGFRAYIRSKAKKLGVNGWIRNLSDDRVECIFQPSAGSGQEGMDKVQKLIPLCNRGPFFANVSDVVVDWEEQTEEFAEFEKRETA
jgi:acylphosphatase